MSKDDHRTVWSSEQGDLRKKQPKSAGATSLPPARQTVYLHRETSGRAGPVTLVKNLVLSADDLKALAKQLKQACGTGGTIKDGVIELQGEQRRKVAAFLQRLGYRVKIAGG
jgi:translation initiation factor 1